jgi:hypothetical protein
VHDSSDFPLDDRTSVERLLGKDLDDLDGLGRPLSRRARHAQRSVEAYLKAGGRPQWMERVMEIDRRIAAERRLHADAYRRLREECGADRGTFAARWSDRARTYPFDPELNELIGQHNDWYPIERDLPMDMRTRDYVLVNGRSYRRPVLDSDWLLGEFPA